MKLHSIALICAGALALLPAICSCDSKAKLAREVTGTWASNPEKLIDSDAMSATAIRMIQFNPSATDSHSGDLQMTALVTIQNAMSDPSPALIEPYTVSASGIASLQGQWAVAGDDEISLRLDESTLSVSVDPEAVLVSVNTINQSTFSSIDTIKPAIADFLKKQISTAVRNQIFNTNSLDDIKISGNLMSCEINRRDVTLRRQEIPVR